MLYLLSPAKALDYESPVAADVPLSQPAFLAQAAELVTVLREQTPAQLASLMKLSDKLAGLNVARYQAWQEAPDAAHVRQAALAFAGDVYRGLDAASLASDELDWLQQHVCILSGLYGVLRPLDAIQPHRLEMGTRLPVGDASNLYGYWGRQIAEHLNQRLAGSADPVVVNLASQEYFKSVDPQALKARVVDCVFQDYKGGQYKVISFYAKRARGMLARWAAQHAVSVPEALQRFDSDGYAFAPAASDARRLVFRRRAP